MQRWGMDMVGMGRYASFEDVAKHLRGLLVP